MRMVASAVVPQFVIWIGTRIKYKKRKVLWFEHSLDNLGKMVWGLC